MNLPKTPVSIPDGFQIITLGAGCFWCTEAVFQRVNGVSKVISGYSGGFVEDPEYRDVCNGITGHAEVIQVTFDPKIVSLTKLLEIFFATHDPTTLNRQGADAGPQYRSAIFYHSESQGEVAEGMIKKLNEAQIFPKTIVTEVTEFTNFYPASISHQDYYNLNKGQPYCQFVIRPKVDKLEQFFAEQLN